MRTDAGILGLRGWAATMVLMYHLGSDLHVPVVGAWLFGWGYSGVDLFFVVSGFLLTRKMLDGDYDRDGRLWATGYYLRRFFRIWPLWLVTLPLFVLLVGAPWTPLALVFGMNYLRPTFWPWPPWTLCIEELFYAVLPLWVLVFRTRAAMPLGVTLAGLSLAWQAWGLSGSVDYYLLWQMPSYAFAYAVGSLAARGWTSPVPRRWVGPLAVGAAPLLVVLQYVPGQAIVAALLYGTILTVGRNAAALAHPVSRWLGERTYPLYLVGLPAQFAAMAVLPSPWLWAPATVGLALVAADVAHRTVERPLIAAGKAVESWAYGRTADRVTPSGVLRD